MRKLAELYLAAGHMFETIANTIAITAPDNRILGVNSVQIGSDVPSPADFQSSFFRSAQRMFEQAEKILKQIAPITNTIEAV